MMEEMNKVQPHVLLVGLGTEALETVVPTLQEDGFSVHTVDASPFVLDLIRGTSFELLVVAFPNEELPIEEVVDAARCPGSLCSNTGLLIFSDPDHVDQAAQWLDYGVNRIVALDWPRARIWQAFSDLLSAAPRVSLSVPIQLLLPREIARDAILLKTSNVSATGALLTGFRTLPLGTRFQFVLKLPGTETPVRGLAEVVRRAKGNREQIDGFGVRYLNLPDESREALNGYIENHA
jgi:hypothetical protein